MKLNNDKLIKNSQKLEMYTLPLTRAHGENHPEVFRVRELFEIMNTKLFECEGGRADLSREFSELRVVTNGYKTPPDACETYEAVYAMLKESDASYHNE